MYFYTLLCLCCSLVNALPQSPPQSLGPNDNPSDSDPPTPPSTLVQIARPSENPFVSSIPEPPAECPDALTPSDACLNAVSVQQGGVEAFGGKIYVDKSCGAREADLRTAFWDALTLANWAQKKFNSIRFQQANHYYMGPDYLDYEQRIKDNIGRAADFKSKSSGYITVSCNDKKGLCNKSKDKKSVAGYAWSSWTIIGYYHYITVCNIFFGAPSLDQKFEQIQDELHKGKTEMATNADWQKTTGQFFLHEMMHLKMIGNPDIIDVKVGPDGLGSYAYGPKLCHKLAQRALNLGGGATRASINADSYAWLINTLYWWDSTGYFPGVPGAHGLAAGAISSPPGTSTPPGLPGKLLQNHAQKIDGVTPRAIQDDGDPILVDLGIVDFVTVASAAFDQRFDEELSSYGDDFPD